MLYKVFQKLCPYVTNADHTFDDFLFYNNRKDRKGIMTNARFGQFNKKFNTNLTYYNENDRHEYPKQMANNGSKGTTVFSFNKLPNIWCCYNYLEPRSNVGNYCLIRRSNNQEGINEIKSNFRKMWNRCNERKVQQVQVYSKKTQKPYDNTTTTTTVYFNEVVFPSVLGLTSPMAFPQHSPPI